jgi:hypothetical protein
MSYNSNGAKLEEDVERSVLPGSRVGIGAEKVDLDGNLIPDNASSVLIESEEGHQIKYKTLTWKKVPSLSRKLHLTSDRCITLLRIHLVILRVWSGD